MTHRIGLIIVYDLNNSLSSHDIGDAEMFIHRAILQTRDLASAIGVFVFIVVDRRVESTQVWSEVSQGQISCGCLPISGVGIMSEVVGKFVNRMAG